MTALRFARLLVPATWIAFVLAPPAWAGQVAVIDQQLTFVAGSGEQNAIEVLPDGLVYDVYDDDSPLIAGPGCAQVDSNHARCTEMVLGVHVDAGDRADIIIMRDVVAPVVASAGTGHDLVVGGSGADQLDGGDGVDTLDGSAGDDHADGGQDDDLLLGGPAEDTLLGAEGADIVEGGRGDDPDLQGGIGRDLVRGGSGRDQLDGNEQNDVLIGGPDVDTVETGPGADRVYVTDEPDNVGCSEAQGDTVRGRARWLRNACPRLAAPRPQRWPPRRPAAAPRPRAQPTQLIPADPEVTVRPFRRGNASVTVVKVSTPYAEVKRVKIVVRLFRRNGTRIDRFKKRVRTRHKVAIEKPKPPRKAHTGKGRCCV